MGISVTIYIKPQCYTKAQCYVLFVVVLELLSKGIRSGCLEDPLYADDLQLDSEILEGPKGTLETCKREIESKKLIVDVKKTKMIIKNENS